MNIIILIAHFSSISVIVPLILAIIQWRRLPVSISSIRWLLISASIIDLLSFIFSKYSIPNHSLGNVYLLIQFSILLYMFSLQFDRTVFFKAAYVAFIIFYFVNLIFFQSFFTFNTNSNVAACLILITVSIMFFYKLLSELKVSNIHRLPILWIAFATLFYYSGNLFLFLASRYLEQSRESYAILWTIHNILNLTKNVLFGIALWQNYKAVRS